MVALGGRDEGRRREHPPAVVEHADQDLAEDLARRVLAERLDRLVVEPEEAVLEGAVDAVDPLHLAVAEQELAALLFVCRIRERQRLERMIVESRRFGVRELLGRAFKPDTDDIRDAPSIPIAAGFRARGATVAAFDPMPRARECAAAQLPDVVARVNGQPISRDDLQRAVGDLEARAGQGVPPDQRDRVLRGVP